MMWKFPNLSLSHHTKKLSYAKNFTGNLFLVYKAKLTKFSYRILFSYFHFLLLEEDKTYDDQ